MVIAYYHQAKTVTNFFIMNLAISDLIFGILTIPSTFATAYWLQYWPFSEFACKVLNCLQTASVTLTVYTLVWLTLDKFWALVMPMKTRMTVNTCRNLMLVSWVLSIAIALPIAINTEVQTLNKTQYNATTTQTVFRKDIRPQCVEKWTGMLTNYMKVYNVSLLVIQYFAPLVFLTFCYATIGFKLMTSATPGVSDQARDGRINRTKIKV
jgi:hypothetical protein